MEEVLASERQKGAGIDDGVPEPVQSEVGKSVVVTADPLQVVEEEAVTPLPESFEHKPLAENAPVNKALLEQVVPPN